MEFECDFGGMHREEFWEPAVRLTLVGREEEGMYLEEREGRKRKWEGKMMRRDDSEDKEQRKMPPKKIMAASLGDMGGSGTSSSSSHMSPGWPVNDIDLELPGELSMNEALLSLPSLAVFKQEAPSPTGAVLSPPRRGWHQRNDSQISSMVVDSGREGMDEGCRQSSPPNHMQPNAGSPESMQCQQMASASIMQISGYRTDDHDNKNTGLLMCSPVTSLDGFLHSPIQRQDHSFKDDTRFQYVLAAATSIATKQNEETLTYLNQGQPYEIKLKKLGDLSNFKGKVLKVFKLKGADRKHKQDREKVMRRPRADLDKYQPGCEATVLTTLSNDALMPPPLVTTSPPYSPEHCVTPKLVSSPVALNKPVLPKPGVIASNNQMKPLYCQDGGDVKMSSPPCHSPGAILPDLPQSADDPEKNCGLSKEASANETQAWLSRHRFSHHAATFANFSGADLLRFSRDDIIQICGLADGIRLFNALHAKRIAPRLTLYVSPRGTNIYTSLYLHACRAVELTQLLRSLINTAKDCDSVLVSGPHGVRVRLTDELVRHLPDNSTYTLERVDDSNAVLLSATEH